jgi:hypothetical protein
MTAESGAARRTAARRVTSSLTRRLQPLFRQQPHRGVGVHRLAEGKPLRVFAAQLVKLDRIGIGLGALGDHVHAEVMRQRDDRFQDHRPGACGPSEGSTESSSVTVILQCINKLMQR